MLSVNQLMTLLEEEELGEVSIHDLVQNSNDAFQRLLEDRDSLEVGLTLNKLDEIYFAVGLRQ
jgi:hypothetical protein